MTELSPKRYCLVCGEYVTNPCVPLYPPFNPRSKAHE